MTIVLDDDAVTARLRPGLIVTDSIAQLHAYDPPALLTGISAVPLGAVPAGEHPGRSHPDAITRYASVGLAGTEPYLLASLLGLQASVR